MRSIISQGRSWLKLPVTIFYRFNVARVMFRIVASGSASDSSLEPAAMASCHCWRGLESFDFAVGLSDKNEKRSTIASISSIICSNCFCGSESGFKIANRFRLPSALMFPWTTISTIDCMNLLCFARRYLLPGGNPIGGEAWNSIRPRWSRLIKPTRSSSFMYSSVDFALSLYFRAMAEGVRRWFSSSVK